MTEHAPGDDTRAQDREDVPIGSLNAGQPASAHGNPGAIAVPEEPIAPLAPALAMAPSEYAEPPAADLIAQQAGVEPKARSQWAYARIRFFRHRMAVVSLFVLFLICLVAIFAKRVAPYGYDELDLLNITSPPTLKDKHLFGTELLGRDYVSRVIFGLRTSLWVAFFVAFL